MSFEPIQRLCGVAAPMMRPNIDTDAIIPSREMKRVSKPGRRVYAGVKDIPSVRQGLGVSIVSTPKGVMSDAAARAANIGGEVLCTVF